MNAATYLSGKRINIELILWMSDKNILHYGVRLRPWKQETRTGIMILVQGLSLEDALNVAAKALYEERWEVLDYAARPWQARTPEAATPEHPDGLEFLAPGATSNAGSSLSVIKGTGAAPKVPKNGS